MNDRLLLGVTGSIAAYKAPMVLRGLRARGFRVPVALTENAQRFVGRVTFESLTTDGVYDDLWARKESLNHISLLEGTGLILVVPATANIIAKAAQGTADDLLSCLLLAADPEKIMFAPAMNTGMWNNPATRENVAKLKQRGVRFVEPGSGELASGVVGKGRLAEIEEILIAAERAVRSHPALKGKRIVVTAGRTEEELDPVRVITNRSSGRMGIQIARAFTRRGADVTLVAGQLSVPLPYGVDTVQVHGAEEMLAALENRPMDVLLMAAAVGDFRPDESSNEKIKDEEVSVKLVKTADVLGSLADSGAIRIGFSVETGEDWLSTARNKMEKKRLDVVVANPARIIGEETTQAVIMFSTGKKIEIPQTTKEVLAEKLVEVTVDLLERNG